MHAKNRKAHAGKLAAPLKPLSAGAALPPTPGSPAPDNKLSGAFAAALGKSGGQADTPPVSVGKERTKGGPDRPDKINKATKPATGVRNFSGRRSGHR